MRILQVKAARGWSREEAARVFLVNEETMRWWLRRMDEEDGSLVRIREPVNKFPDFVGCRVRQSKVLLPALGKSRVVGWYRDTPAVRRSGSDDIQTGAVALRHLLVRCVSQ